MRNYETIDDLNVPLEVLLYRLFQSSSFDYPIGRYSIRKKMFYS